MMASDDFQKEIANVLQKIGSKKCLEKAELIAGESSPIRSLHLRNLELDSSNIESIAACLKQEASHENYGLRSISFSYNSLFGDSGAISLANNLPDSICEMTLVN